MEPLFQLPAGLSKAEQYKHFLELYLPYMEGEDDAIAAMANTAAALHEAFHFFWVGFYLVKDAEWLSLGPFQGSLACSRIKRGRGVCGTAWAEARTLIVPDVDAFPGHIACSGDSRSEIVVPILDPASKVLGVIDVDSDHLAAFDDDDRQGLEAVARRIAETLKV